VLALVCVNVRFVKELEYLPFDPFIISNVEKSKKIRGLVSLSNSEAGVIGQNSGPGDSDFA